MQLQIQAREITLDGLHPDSTWPPRWTPPALRVPEYPVYTSEKGYACFALTCGDLKNRQK